MDPNLLLFLAGVVLLILAEGITRRFKATQSTSVGFWRFVVIAFACIGASCIVIGAISWMVTQLRIS